MNILSLGGLLSGSVLGLRGGASNLLCPDTLRSEKFLHLERFSIPDKTTVMKRVPMDPRQLRVLQWLYVMHLLLVQVSLNIGTWDFINSRSFLCPESGRVYMVEWGAVKNPEDGFSGGVFSQ